MCSDPLTPAHHAIGRSGPDQMVHPQPSSGTVLRWRSPATDWLEATPIGNGRLGAMVFGGRDCRIQINDATVWSGRPDDGDRELERLRSEGANPTRLREVRQAIAAKDYERAETLVKTFEGRYTQTFLPFLDMQLFTVADSGTTRRTVRSPQQAPEGSRTLDLATGLVAEELTFGPTAIDRTVYASAPAQALVVEQSTRSTDPLVRFSVCLRVSSSLRRAGTTLVTDDGRGVVVGLQPPIDAAPPHEPDVRNPLRYAEVDESEEAPATRGTYDPYAAAVVLVDTDGSVQITNESVQITNEDVPTTRIDIRAAGHLTIVVCSSTAGEDYWNGAPALTRPEHHARALGRARGALGRPDRRSEHELDLARVLGDMSVRIGHQPKTVDVADLLKNGDDSLVATTMFAYGRYLLAQSSRAGSPPANLQGIWNTELWPPWSSNYTVNINTEMNYWCALPTGLPEDVDQPLVDLVEALSHTGSRVARELYGTRGWVCHHNTDMWAWALPVGMGHGSPSWAIWMMGGHWLAQQLWERWLFRQDREELTRSWPIVKGLAEFSLDWLVPGPDGLLDTCPSTSPENLFVDADGHHRSLTRSATMDIALIRATFEQCLAMANILGVSDPVLDEIQTALRRLRPFGINADGRIREWGEDLPEQDPHHRHMSPLIAVYPLGLLDPTTAQDPHDRALLEAAERLLDLRGSGAMGWSWAWKIALWARFRRGDRALAMLQEATRPFGGDPHQYASGGEGTEWGGLLPNLFSTHPPFQLDGNYGYSAGIAEMFIQSHAGRIDLLPALPASWGEGSVRGARARGGLVVSFDWCGGRITRAWITRVAGDPTAVVTVVTGECVDRQLIDRGETVCLAMTNAGFEPQPTPTTEKGTQ